MPRLLISPYSELLPAVRRHKPSHVLSVLADPVVERPASIAPDRHLQISMHDIYEPTDEMVAPSPRHIARILSFGRGWDRTLPFLVHCWAGISRSTAAAYILLCDMHGPGHELTIAKALRFHAPHAQPNPLMVSHADTLLGRKSRMIDAVRALGEGVPAAMGEVVQLPIALEEL
jgi:predicted protein tyrosine phosphatase